MLICYYAYLLICYLLICYYVFKKYSVFKNYSVFKKISPSSFSAAKVHIFFVTNKSFVTFLRKKATKSHF